MQGVSRTGAGTDAASVAFVHPEGQGGILAASRHRDDIEPAAFDAPPASDAGVCVIGYDVRRFRPEADAPAVALYPEEIAVCRVAVADAVVADGVYKSCFVGIADDLLRLLLGDAV